jgi:nitroreductase
MGADDADAMPDMVPLAGYRRRTTGEMIAEAADFARSMSLRRTVREFASEPPPRAVIESALAAAASAPSGANMQPWRFVVVTRPDLKRRIRVAAEAEERSFYAERASPEWLAALAPLGTDPNKPFLETAPYLIAVFAERYGTLPDGRRVKHYYVGESVGIATGILIVALHRAGLATLTHTPSPMAFLNEILERPSNERPFLLLVAGYPGDDARVPDITRKPIDSLVQWR